MDFRSRLQFESGDSWLSEAQEENFDCCKMTSELRRRFDQDDLLEEVKEPDILLNASYVEPIIQAVGDLQKEVKIEEESDVDGVYVSPLNAAELLDETVAEEKVKIEEIFDHSEEILGSSWVSNRADFLMDSKEVKEEAIEQCLKEEVLNPKNSSKKTDKRHLFNCPVELCPLSCVNCDLLNEHVKRRHSDEEFLSCDVCMKTFSSSLDDAMTHIWQRETKKCCACGKSFDTKGGILVHIRTHWKPFFCGDCMVRFAKEDELEEHKRTHLAVEQPFDKEDMEQDEDDFENNGSIDDLDDDDMDDIEESSEFENDEEVAQGSSYKKKKSHRGVSRHLFTCLLKNCSSSYTKFEELEEHTKIHFGKQEPFCDVCKKTFPSKEDALEHIRQRESRECCACGKTFSQNGFLVPHLRCHSGERPFVCRTCGKRFSQPSHLHVHLLKHSGEKPFSCGLCGKRYVLKAALKVHERTHSGERPFKCNNCEYNCKSSSCLTMHKLRHTGEKPHFCEYCNKRFYSKSSLKTHERTHTGERPYECDYCEYKCNNPSGMKVHKRVHTGERPYSCGLCEKRFSTSSNLKSHVATHTGEKAFKCEDCGRRFNRKCERNRHIRVHHENHL